MIWDILHRTKQQVNTNPSILCDEVSFYEHFLKDIKKCKSELIIESPFITSRRVSCLLPAISKLKSQRVKVIINTKDPAENEAFMKDEALRAIAKFQTMGVQVIYTKNHHRKLAIIDREILWEGSLNILSQCKSKELMRRIESSSLSWDMVRFTNLDSLIN